MTTFLAFAFLGCGSPQPISVADGPDPAGWISQAALKPQDFAALTEGHRDGWIALHANDLDAALEAFPDGSVGKARAQWQLALYHRDMSRLTGLVNHRLFTTWKERTGLPKQSAAVSIAALAASCSVYSLDTWTLDAAANDFVHKLANEEPPYGLDEDHPIARRMRMHRKVVKNADAALLNKHAAEPVVVEQGTTFDRSFYDPCLHNTLATHWEAQAAATLGGDDWKAVGSLADKGLAGSLFAPWIDQDTLRAGVEAHSDPGLLGLKEDAHLPGNDDLAAARGEVRALDKELHQWRERLLAQAGDDGDALLTDLDLVGRYRQEWLVVRARQALMANRGGMALAYLEMARDVTTRGVGPANGPALLALTAEAQLRLGHTREALDSLQLLVEARPDATGAREHAGDLAVLQGLDRQGDSKEH